LLIKKRSLVNEKFLFGQKDFVTDAISAEFMRILTLAMIANKRKLNAQSRFQNS